MPWTDCRFTLKTTQDAERMVLQFKEPFWGVRWDVCKIEKPVGEPIMETEIPQLPDRFTRFVFRLFLGLRDYKPVMGLRCSKVPENAILFYECSDRKGRERTMASTTVKWDHGASFMVKREDFDRVRTQIAEADAASVGQGS